MATRHTDISADRADLDRLRAELAEQKAVNLQLAKRLAAASEVLAAAALRKGLSEAVVREILARLDGG